MTYLADSEQVSNMEHDSMFNMTGFVFLFYLTKGKEMYGL